MKFRIAIMRNGMGPDIRAVCKGIDIPLAARLFAVVDVYDALTSDRPYRPAWTPEQALDYVAAQSGKHFEPAIVDAFLSLKVLQL